MGLAAVNSLVAIANIDIGAFDLRAQTITADGLTAKQVVFAGTNGVLSSDADFTFDTDTLTVTKLGATTLTGTITGAGQTLSGLGTVGCGALTATGFTITSEVIQTAGAWAFQKAYTISTGGNNLLTIGGGTAGVKIVTGHLGVVGAVNLTHGIDYTETWTVNDNTPYYGITTDLIINRITGTSSGGAYGIVPQVSIGASNTQNWTGAIGLEGVQSTLFIVAGATGTVTGAAGFVAYASFEAMTVISYYGAYIYNAVGAGTVPTQYGIYLEAMTKGGTNYAVYSVGGKALSIGGSTDSAAVANEVSYGAYEIAADHRGMAWSAEEVVVAEVDETKFSHKWPVRINGATYNVMLCAT
jgi:hypothetical protein